MALPNTTEIDPLDQYNGLNNLKKAGVRVQLTKEQAEEIWKCKNDFEYFLENYVQILSLDSGTVPFKPFGYQRRAMKKIVANRFSILRWPRQMGKTTTVAAVLLWYAIFNKKYNIYVLAQQRGQAMEILDRIKEMYEALPWWFQPGVYVWNKGSIQLGNKSKIVTAATGGSGVRGKSVNLLYLDEFAWVDNDVEFYTATYPVVSSGDTSKIIITSTPNGMNLFYKLWTEALRGENEYVWDDALWHEHPKRDQAWYDQQMANMSPRQFAQEFMCVGYDTRITLKENDYIVRMPIGLLDEICPGASSEENKYIKDLELKKAMEEISGVVYRITRYSDGLSYIGTAKDFGVRLESHKRSPRFRNEEIEWEILFEGTLQECLDLEESFISKYDTWKNGLNLTQDGKGNHTAKKCKFNTIGHRFSEESRMKMSISAKERIKKFGPPKPVFSEESRKKMSELRKGKRWGPLALSKEDVLKINSHPLKSSNPSIQSLRPFLKKSQVDKAESLSPDSLITPGGTPLSLEKTRLKIASQELGFSVYLIKKVWEGRYD